MRRVILISGKQGSGKSTLARNLIFLATKSGLNPNVIKFADPLYLMHDACLPVLKSYGIRPEGMTKDGELLQVLGTEFGRVRIGQNVWADACKKAVQTWLDGPGFNVAVIDDARFENEFESFPGAFRVRLTCAENLRRGRCSYWRENTSHPSEIGLDAFEMDGKFDMVVDTGALESPVVAANVFGEWLKR